MTYRLDLFDSSGNRKAILQDDIIIAAELSLAIDGAPSVSVTIPQDCDKASFINPQYYLKIWNTETGAYEHSIFRLYDPEIIDSDSELLIKATYQGILTRLSEEYVDSYDTTDTGKAFSTVISELLAYQVNAPEITVGTIEPTQTIAIAAESSDIYSVLNNIRSAYGGWFEVDSLYRLNWYNDNTGDPVRQIRRSKNLKAISYTPQYQSLVNRVYAYGKGEGDARINLDSYNEYIATVRFTDGDLEITSGQTARVGPSTSSAGLEVVIVDSVLISGSYASGDAAGYIIYYKTGTTSTIPTGYVIYPAPFSATIYGAVSANIQNPLTNSYIEDTASQATYGVRARKFIDKTITHPIALLKWALQILEERKDPPYQYSVDVLNLADVSGYNYSFESLGLDTRVRVIDDLLNVDVNTAIVSITLNLQAPENIQVELSTIKNDISDLFSDILSIQDISQSVATQIGAGQVTVLGTFSVIDWVTGGTTTIDGGNITAGTITTSQLNFSPVDSDNIIATINLSEESGGTLTIDADKISISGTTTFASGYDPSGKIATGGAAADVNNNTTTISGGKITTNSISANTLTTSTMTSRTITLSGSDSVIQGNYTAGSAGWKIDGNGDAEFNSVTVNGYVQDEGGQYNSAASGARVRIFPDANTGISVTDGISNVFECLVGGTDVGDVIIGDYTGGNGVKWDNSGGTLDVKGSLSACTVGTGQTITVNGTIDCGDILIKGVGFNYILIDNTYYTRLEDGVFNIGTGLGSYNFTASIYGIQCIQTGSSAYFTTINSTRGINFNNATVSLGTTTTFTGDFNCDDINCQDISCDDIGCDELVCGGDLTMTGTSGNGRIEFGDTSHYIYKSGNDLYYYDGTTSTKLN